MFETKTTSMAINMIKQRMVSLVLLVLLVIIIDHSVVNNNIVIDAFLLVDTSTSRRRINRRCRQPCIPLKPRLFSSSYPVDNNKKDDGTVVTKTTVTTTRNEEEISQAAVRGNTVEMMDGGSTFELTASSFGFADDAPLTKNASYDHTKATDTNDSSTTLLQELSSDNRIKATAETTTTTIRRKVFQPIMITEDTNKVPTKPISAAPITNSLQQFQKLISGPIVASSFSGMDNDDHISLFRPLITNCHIQTIGGFLLRQNGYGKYVSSYQCLLEQIMDATILNNNNNSNNNKDKNDHTKSRIDDNNNMNRNDSIFRFWDHREKISTPDGDWFHADTKYAADDGDDDHGNTSWLKKITSRPTVLLLHGLNSNSQSGLSIDIAKAVVGTGMNCICLNFRGCSGLPNDTLRFYHLGFTYDIQYYLQLINQRWLKQQSVGRRSTPPPVFYLSGFSLGANAALKCLGELGERAIPEYNVYGGAVLCAPLDNIRNAKALEQPGINKSVYTKNLLNGLKDRARVTLGRFCDGDINTPKFDYQRLMESETITEFDDAFTAQIYGFDDCWDYYSQTSSIHYLDSIAVPTMILNAKDDPFFDPSVWPIEKSYCNGGTAPIKFVRTEHGGHLGFAFHQVEPDDDRLLRQNTNQRRDGNTAAAATTVKEKDSLTPSSQPPPCWGSSQVAEFLCHVQNHESTALLQQSKKINFFTEEQV